MSTPILLDRMRQGEITRTKHFGQSVLIEKQPIRLIQIPVLGEKLHESLLVHPKYASDKLKLDFRPIEVIGLRRGRTIEILLDEPIVIGGVEYYVLSIKGVGADATEPMMFHPERWFENDEYPATWVRRNNDGSERYWGALTCDAGRDEFESHILPSLGLPIVPHINLIDIPQSLADSIGLSECGVNMPPLCQLFRLMRTNIRFVDVTRGGLNLYSQADTNAIIEIDAKFISGLLTLAQKGKRLSLMGDIPRNRLIDGMFVDAENFVIEDNLPNSRFVETLLDASMSLFNGILFSSNLAHYLYQLEERTGVPFTTDYSHGSELNTRTAAMIFFSALQKAAQSGSYSSSNSSAS